MYFLVSITPVRLFSVCLCASSETAQLASGAPLGVTLRAARLVQTVVVCVRIGGGSFATACIPASVWAFCHPCRLPGPCLCQVAKVSSVTSSPVNLSFCTQYEMLSFFQGVMPCDFPLSSVLCVTANLIVLSLERHYRYSLEAAYLSRSHDSVLGQERNPDRDEYIKYEELRVLFLESIRSGNNIQFFSDAKYLYYSPPH